MRPRDELASRSRATTNELLAELRAGRWRPQAWRRFLSLAAVRSWDAARQRPRAAVEVTALHGVLAALGRRPGHRPRGRWVAVSWALSMTHLGMLESRRSLGVANAVTLVRANLPVVLRADARVLAAVALLSDVVDGWLARRLGTATPFGRDADSVADAAFWIWFALRHEPDRRLRLLALGAWAVPVASIAVTSMARGRMVDAPRPATARPTALMQIVLAARALSRAAGSKASGRRRRRGWPR